MDRIEQLEQRIADLEHEAEMENHAKHEMQDELDAANRYIATLEAQLPPVDRKPSIAPRLVERTDPNHGTYSDWEAAA
jgi:septal ring factor EnvC (AmiA/AmiB activator)